MQISNRFRRFLYSCCIPREVIIPLVPERVKGEKQQFPECITKSKGSKNGHVFWDVNIWDLSFRLLCIAQRVCYRSRHSSMLNTVSSLNMLMLCFPGEVLSHISADLCPISLLVVLSRARALGNLILYVQSCMREPKTIKGRETLWEQKKLSVSQF